MVRKAVKWFYTCSMFLFLYAPIIVLIIYSFNASKSRGSWDGFTLKWYIELFRNRFIKKALLNTISIAIFSSIIATVLGTISAIGIFNMKWMHRKVLLNINYLPVLNPDIVTGVSLMTLFISLRMTLGYSTMLLAHITFSVPYVILIILPRLRQMDKNLAEAALDLGATPFYALRKVIIPEIMPGIVSGALIAFTLSIDDFVISFFTTGSGVDNLSILIYSMARRGVKPVINALSTLMLLTVFVLLYFLNKKTNHRILERVDM